MMSITRLVNKNSNVYEINLYDFLIYQEKIALKFIDNLSNNTEMEIMDKYIMHIFEEIWEVKEAKIPIEAYEELCDVLMYIGSLYTIISKRSNISLTEIKPKYKVIQTADNDLVDLEIIRDKLVSIRRFYPARKWHKKENYKLIDTCIDEISLEILLECMIDIVCSLIKLEGFNFEAYITSKEHQILN